jgi:hypothetical protein
VWIHFPDGVNIVGHPARANLIYSDFINEIKSTNARSYRQGALVDFSHQLIEKSNSGVEDDLKRKSCL